MTKSESHVECVAPAVDGAKDLQVPLDVVVQVLGVSTKVGTYMYQAPSIESTCTFLSLVVYVTSCHFNKCIYRTALTYYE